MNVDEKIVLAFVRIISFMFHHQVRFAMNFIAFVLFATDRMT